MPQRSCPRILADRPTRSNEYPYAPSLASTLLDEEEIRVVTLVVGVFLGAFLTISNFTNVRAVGDPRLTAEGSMHSWRLFARLITRTLTGWSLRVMLRGWSDRTRLYATTLRDSHVCFNQT